MNTLIILSSTSLCVFNIHVIYLIRTWKTGRVIPVDR
jgi:hypothetical protein